MQSVLKDKVLKAQEKDLKIEEVRKEINSGVEMPFPILKDGS